MIIIYHANCNDGHCAAWLLHRCFPDAQYVPAHYGQEPPDVTGQDVIIADFSYKREVLEEMHAKAKTLIVLDHHKTAEADLKGLHYCVFDMSKSGAMLVSDYYKQTSWLVPYVQDRDLWQWALPNSREINAGLASYPLTFEDWDAVEKMGSARLISEGITILRYEKKLIDLAVRNAREHVLSGSIVLGVNSTVLFSDIAGELAKGKPFGFAWFRRKDGKYQYSLRSEPNGEDVSLIAKCYGGGGHKHAAGFESDIMVHV